MFTFAYHKNYSAHKHPWYQTFFLCFACFPGSLNLPWDMRLQWHKTVQNAPILFRLRHNTHQKVQFCRFPCSQVWFWDTWLKTTNHSTSEQALIWQWMNKRKKIKSVKKTHSLSKFFSQEGGRGEGGGVWKGDHSRLKLCSVSQKGS